MNDIRNEGKNKLHTLKKSIHHTKAFLRVIDSILVLYKNEYDYISMLKEKPHMEKSKENKSRNMMKEVPLCCTKFFKCSHCGYVSLSNHPCPICKTRLEPDFHWKKI